MACQLVVDERYEEAVDALEACIEKEEEPKKKAALYATRSFAFLKLEKHTHANRDASAALGLDENQEAAWYRKGLACFALDEFETALSSFQRGEKLVDESVKERRRYAMWIRKCLVELEDEEEEEEEPFKVPETVSDGKKTAPNTIKYQYYQTDAYLTVSVLARGVTEERSTINIEEKALLVRIMNSEGFEMTVITGELWDFVVPELSSIKYLPSKVDIKLKKKENFNWNELLLGDTIGGDDSKKKNLKKIIPATEKKKNTPYASSRDWNTIEKEVEDELEKEKPEGEEALNKLFKDIYARSDPETRRAMNKSFQTSGGTVLSTNWGEVKQADYEAPNTRQAPAGMIWKDWEGNKLPQKDSTD